MLIFVTFNPPTGVDGSNGINGISGSFATVNCKPGILVFSSTTTSLTISTVCGKVSNLKPVGALVSVNSYVPNAIPLNTKLPVSSVVAVNSSPVAYEISLNSAPGNK